MDTSAWIALQVEDDDCARAACAIFPEIEAKFARFVTTNHVVGETYTYLRTRCGYAEAWRFLSVVDRSWKLDVVRVSEREEMVAYRILRKYRDHPFSYVDATSFAAMKERGIRAAFAFDAHFAVMGFAVLPGTKGFR